jgi:hypothetical protein
MISYLAVLQFELVGLEEQRDQATLLRTHVEDYVPADRSVRVITVFIDDLATSAPQLSFGYVDFFHSRSLTQCASDGHLNPAGPSIASIEISRFALWDVGGRIQID